MTLRTCPDCKADVSDQAPSCPHCGRPLGRARVFGSGERGQTVRPSIWHDRNAGAVGCLLLFIILAVALRGC